MEKWERTPQSEMRRLEQNFLVHSFLYYILDEPIITDERYDSLCKELSSLLPFVEPQYPITKKMGAEGSGFYIKTYHPKIVSRALLLLYWNSSTEEDFPSFARKRGWEVSN